MHGHLVGSFLSIIFLLLFCSCLSSYSSFSSVVFKCKSNSTLCFRFILFSFTFQATLLDMVVYIVLKNTGYSKYAIRWSRVLRPAFIINFSESRQVKISIALNHVESICVLSCAVLV